MPKSRIYLDYTSLTPIDPRVQKVINKYSAEEYGNPSAWYKEGVSAKNVLDESRKTVATFLNAHADEIIFTSGGTEANNLAIMGVVNSWYARRNVESGETSPRSRIYTSKSISRNLISNHHTKPHIIVSTIEHSSILEVVKHLEKDGVEVTYINVDKNGIIILDELKEAIKPNTIIVSIMTVNNETGVIQPIKEIAKIIRHARAKYNPEEKFLDNRSRALYPLFHTDACQGAIHLDLNVEKLGVDILTLDGSKVYGPRGVGCLYVKRSVIGRKTLDDVGLIQPINFGGGQERGIRSGTENVSNIAGFAEALRIIYDGTDKSAKNRKKEYKRVEDLRNKFIVGLQKIRSDITVNGFLDSKERGNTYPENFAKSSDNKRLFNNLVHPSQSPHILSITIPNIDNEFLLFQLDAKGIACSTKSACLRDEDESYVLKAMGVNSRETMRFSLGRWSKNADITRVLRIFGDSDIIPPTC